MTEIPSSVGWVSAQVSARDPLKPFVHQTKCRKCCKCRLMYHINQKGGVNDGHTDTT